MCVECYSACYCDDPDHKDNIAASIKSAEDSLEAMDITCTLNCGIVSAPDYSSIWLVILIAFFTACYIVPCIYGLFKDDT